MLQSRLREKGKKYKEKKKRVYYPTALTRVETSVNIIAPYTTMNKDIESILIAYDTGNNFRYFFQLLKLLL